MEALGFLNSISISLTLISIGAILAVGSSTLRISSLRTAGWIIGGAWTNTRRVCGLAMFHHVPGSERWRKNVGSANESLIKAFSVRRRLGASVSRLALAHLPPCSG